MSTDPTPSPELRDLADAVLDGRLSPEGRDRLEALVLGDPAARAWYAAYLHQHACLHWAAHDAAVRPAPARRPRRHRLAWAGLGAALAAGVAAALWLGTAGPRTVATLVSAKSCLWGEGSLPAAEGVRLAPGRLKLAEGLARLRFDTGAEVALEAPAELEVVSAGRCVLRSGRLVAKVPPPAVGFVVDTPTAELTDQGTEFGVSVRDGAAADLQVFDGRVDVLHRPTGRSEQVLTGRSVRFTADAVAEFGSLAERSPAPPPPPHPGRVVTLSTAGGRGKDAYVQGVVTPEHQSDVLLLVKNNPRPDYDRKAYLGFDLAALARGRVADAQLTLTFEPTGMGYASEVPDATFAVYGVTDESLDGWDERGVTWKTAPANRPGGAALDGSKVVRLGTFAIAQGELRGTRTVGGPALVEFLNGDTNGLATLVVVRETPGSGRADLVHGFAGREHPTLPPPTLKLEVVPR